MTASQTPSSARPPVRAEEGPAPAGPAAHPPVAGPAVHELPGQAGPGNGAGAASGEAAAPAPPRVIGLDLSLTATGVATADGQTFTISSKAAGDRRLVEIQDTLLDHIVRADLAVLEDLPFHAKAAGQNGMVQGVVRAALLDSGTPYVVVVAASLKKYATGNGAADKHAMRMEAYKRAGVEFADDNQCDAWWLRLMGLDGIGRPALDLPARNRESLTKVTWPVIA